MMAAVRSRLTAWVAAVLVCACVVLFFPLAGPAQAAPVPNGPCSQQDWQDPANFDLCVSHLPDLTEQEIQCVSPPTPANPTEGFGGFFAGEPDSSRQPGPKGLYSRYAYAGYEFDMYDTGCLQSTVDSRFNFENSLANGEFLVATAIVGGSNALREKAWEPASMWGWANPLVEKATQSIYRQVFTVFGTLTLAVIGLYLLWRSRQSDMSTAMTTAGWALLVMVAVTAIAAWPVRSANLADDTLVAGLGVVHSAVGPQAQDIPPNQCTATDPAACADHRPPAVRAGDTAVQTLLYRNWLRGELGSADSPTAQKYGAVLYDAKAFSWDQLGAIKASPQARQALITSKQRDWMKVAKQIKTEDPEAYQYLQGNKGWDRVGAGLIAILSALFFALFDITASILVLLGFVIFRWAVIAAPVLGTVGMLRPASAGIRRLANAVVAALFNIIIFGAGASVYLFAVDLIMNTPSIPGWLQITLVLLCGVVGWLLLRPYRRVTQLSGKTSATQLILIGSRSKVVVEERDRRTGDRLAGRGLDPAARPETRGEDPAQRPAAPGRGTDRGTGPEGTGVQAPVPATAGGRRTGPQWTAPEVSDPPASYSVYRPDSDRGAPSRRPALRPESARPESATIGG